VKVNQGSIRVIIYLIRNETGPAEMASSDRVCVLFEKIEMSLVVVPIARQGNTRTLSVNNVSNVSVTKLRVSRKL